MECDSRYQDFLKNNTAPPGGACYPQYATASNKYDTKWDSVLNYCQKISLGWAVGGDLVIIKI